MIGWADLIGRAIEFMVERVTGKKLDLTMDDRRKAARQFLRLYHAVLDLEVLLQEVTVELRDLLVEPDPTTSREWMYDVTTTIDETSERFLEATQGLLEVLNIFDPVLAETLCGLEAHKFSFLIIAARGFEPLVEGNDLQRVNYTHPAASVATLDLGADYQWYLDRYPRDLTKPLEWPHGASLNALGQEDIAEDFFTPRDPQSMLRLANLLDEHVKTLTAARKGLATLLRERFTLEDLLALQQPISQFNRIHAMRRMSESLAVPYTRWFAGKPVRRIRTSQQSNEISEATKRDTNE